ncbi:hypothetical protein F4782DRAFT_545015 [Xylaria castorea]|nr:hypothetical protein F4782DRAFT_545015 [Xylaria castorea]
MALINDLVQISWIEGSLPVLFGCFFCPSGESGLLLFGIPDVPGIYPPPPSSPFPGFPSVIIGNDGNLTVDADDSTTTDGTSSSIPTPSESLSSSSSSTTSSSTPTSTMVAVTWEQWSSTEESTSDDDAAAEFAQSQIDSAFGTTTSASSGLEITTSSISTPSEISFTSVPITTSSTPLTLSPSEISFTSIPISASSETLAPPTSETTLQTTEPLITSVVGGDPGCFTVTESNGETFTACS